MDLLSELLARAQFGLQEPHVHTFDGAWAFDLPTGSPLLFFVRRGRCCLWPAGARHSFSLSGGHVLLVFGERECSLQSLGPRRDAATPFPWDTGVGLNRPLVLPGSESSVQVLSARVEWVKRPVSPSLPSILRVGPGQLALRPGRTTLHDALAEELLAPRQGTEVLVRRLLEAMVIRALRTEISAGFWSVHGWLGALTDPVLRTGLGEAGEKASLQSVKSLADASRRSVRRLSARLKDLSGKRPRKLLAQLRMQRAVQQL
jgi:hypothetical protein